MLQKLAGVPSWFGLLSVLALAILAAAPLAAEETYEFAVKPQPSAAEDAARQDRVDTIHETAAAWDATHPDASGVPTLRVAGVAIMRFRTAAGGYTPEQRYEIVQSRLVTATSGMDYNAANSVTTAVVDGSSVIYLRGIQLVTITAADATANHGTASSLAETWAANLRRGLAAQSVQ